MTSASCLAKRRCRSPGEAPWCTWGVRANRLHELMAGDGGAAGQQQLREQRPLLRRPEACGSPLDEDLDQAKDPELVHRKQ